MGRLNGGERLFPDLDYDTSINIHHKTEIKREHAYRQEIAGEPQSTKE